MFVSPPEVRLILPRAKTSEPLMVMLLPLFIARSPPTSTLDPTLVVLSVMLVPPFFALPQVVTVLSLNSAVVILISPFVVVSDADPPAFRFEPIFSILFPATRTRFPPDSILPFDSRVERMLLALEDRASSLVALTPLIL